MPRKVRQLISDLTKAGFVMCLAAKARTANFVIPGFPDASDGKSWVRLEYVQFSGSRDDARVATGVKKLRPRRPGLGGGRFSTCCKLKKSAPDELER